MPQQSKHPPASKADPPPRRTEHDLDSDLDDTFPASDPVAAQQRVTAKPPPPADKPGKDHGVLPAPTDEQKAQARRNKRNPTSDSGRHH